MAKFIVAGKSEVHFDDATGGALRNMTSHIDTMSAVARQFAQIDVSTFNDAAERFINGIELSQEFTVEGPFDDTATTGPDVVFSGLVGGTAVTFRFRPVGTSGGDRSFQAEVICTSYQIVTNVKERVSYIATFKQDGAMTVGTV